MNKTRLIAVQDIEPPMFHRLDTGWDCFICLRNASINAYGNTWCKEHFEQSADYLGIDKGKTHMQMRKEWNEK